MYRNPAANMQHDSIINGPLTTADMDRAHIERTTFAACSGPCRQGKLPCPNPQACLISLDIEEGEAVGFWLTLAAVLAPIAAVVLIYLYAGDFLEWMP